MPFALKVGQRMRLHVAFFRVDGSRSTVAGPPIWTSSNPAMVAIVEDPLSPDGRLVYAECLGPVAPAVTSPIVEVSCAREVDLGAGVRLVPSLPFEIQPEAEGTTAAVIVAELPEQILTPERSFHVEDEHTERNHHALDPLADPHPVAVGGAALVAL